MVWPKLANAPLMQESSNDQAAVAPSEDQQAEVQYDALVSFTEDGYSPSEVTIKKGQTVRFANTATTDIETWPASAVHPTHSLYPVTSDSDCLGSSFDACQGLKPGGSWQFTFSEVGEWRFHAHLHPSKFGVVNVTE